MPRLKALILTTPLILLSITLIAVLETEINRLNTENTFNTITASVFDTSLGYNYNHTVQLTLNTTLTNKGPLDLLFKTLNSTILVGGKPVRVTSLINLTLRAVSSLSLSDSEGVMNIPDQDESLYRALKARNLRIEVDFSGVAEAGGVTRGVILSGNTTTGFLHGPGEGPPGPSDFPFEGLLNSYSIPRASQVYVSLVGTMTSSRARDRTNFEIRLIISE